MKPTQVLLKGRSRLNRLPLSTKNARKGYYKGNGSGHMGTWDPNNTRRFVPDWEKVRTYVFPERGLEGFKVRKSTLQEIRNRDTDDVLGEKKGNGKWGG